MEGVVVGTKDGLVQVDVRLSTACEGCLHKTVCAMGSGCRSRIIEVKTTKEYAPGQKVEVLISNGLGMAAVLIGYVLPLFSVLAALVSVYALTGREILAAVCGLLVLAPYYLFLKMCKKRLDKKFRFEIE